MRSRSLDSSRSIATKWRWGSTVSNPNPAWSTGTGFARKSVKTMVDYVTPQFKKLSSAGSIVNNPMSSTKLDYETGFGPYLVSQVNNTSTGDRNFGDLRAAEFPAPITAAMLPSIATLCGAPDVLPNMIVRASTDCMAKVGSSKNQSLTSLGEIRETIAFLRNPIGQGLKLANSIENRLSRRVLRGERYGPGVLRRRLDRENTKSVYEECSSLYLEMMYGLRPLVSEISQYASELSDRNVWRQPPRETARAREEHSYVGNYSRTTSESGITYTEDILYHRETRVRTGCMYHWWADVDSANRFWGTRFTDIPSTLWALTPSSFVLDWFFNTNKFIQAITPMYGLAHDATWTSIEIVHTVTRNLRDHKVTGWTTTGATGGSSATLKYVERSRDPKIKIGLAPTQVTSGLADLGSSQAASLFAMFTQRITPLIRDLGYAHANRRAR